MKKYSSKQTHKGKVAYRTPSRFIAKKVSSQRVWHLGSRLEKKQIRREKRK